MKLIRYQDASGSIHFASMQPDGQALRIDGHPLENWTQTKEVAKVAKILAPIEQIGRAHV